MEVFWHSSFRIADPAVFARLSLSFEGIVAPDDAEGYIPHSQLQRPSVPEGLRKFWPKQEFWPSSARADRAFNPYSAYPDWETAYEKFGEDFANAQYELLKVKNLKFEHYLRTAALNHGVLLGDTELGDSDFKEWLKDDLRTDETTRRLQIVRAFLVSRE